MKKRPSRTKGKAPRPAEGRPQKAEFHLAKHDKNQLLDVLHDGLGLSPKSKSVRMFACAVELAITGFSVYRTLEKERPGARSIEAALKEFRGHTSELKKALDAMNADTRFLLELSLQAPMFHIVDAAMPRKQSSKEPVLAMIEAAWVSRIAAQTFIGRLTQDLTTLEVATAVAETAPRHAKSGRPKEHWRLELASEIARAFVQCFKAEIGATADGPFASVLGICLSAAGAGVKDLNRLAEDTVGRIKAQERE